MLVQMSKTQKFAIARLIVRKAGVPRFVALVPQMEVFDANGQVTHTHRYTHLYLDVT